MRFLLVSVLLLAIASCAWPPPDMTASAPAPPGPVALAPAPPPPGPVALAPAPTAVPPPPVEPAPPLPVASTDPWWILTPVSSWLPPSPKRLTLSNFTFDSARVQALVTGYPDCVPRPETQASEFELPLNATRIIEAAPGLDVCWRRSLPPGDTPTAVASPPGWTEWNRVFLSSGRSVDSRL